MATYDYKCKKCGVIEVTKKMTDEEPVICPKCGCEDFKRIYTAAPVQFNCKGFYSTDNK